VFDEFVQLTNDLPQYLPEIPANTRVREEVTLAWCGTTAA